MSAWIEINEVPVEFTEEEVALLVSAWIEINEVPVEFTEEEVALLVSARYQVIWGELKKIGF